MPSRRYGAAALPSSPERPSTSSSYAASADAVNALFTPAAVDSYAQFSGFDLDPAAFFANRFVLPVENKLEAAGFNGTAPPSRWP